MKLTPPVLTADVTSPGRHKGQNCVGDSDIDQYRSIVFPNNIRELRKEARFPKLLALSVTIPEIPYVRLSKIERGEVFAKVDELNRIAETLNVSPERLLIDIDTPEFDIGDWAANLQDWEGADPEEDRFAVHLAAAIRVRRESDNALSIAAIERDYGIAPVILSRLENAHKTFDRWNAQTVRAVCSLLGVSGVPALRDYVSDAWANGMLDSHLKLIANPTIREAKTRERVAALRNGLAGNEASVSSRAKTAPPHRSAAAAPAQTQDRSSPVISAIQAANTTTVRVLPVFGSPLPDGLIERTATGDTIEAPRRAGPNAYGLRVCRPTLGPALPGHAVVVVDPDRFPSAGGIAVLRETAGLLRLLIINADRQGRIIGYSLNPDREVPLDAVDPADLATVVSAILE
jgi:transcriptional regulator with XRE-family HTH domain